MLFVQKSQHVVMKKVMTIIFKHFVTEQIWRILYLMPPNQPFALESCLEYMPIILDRIWLGAWISQYEAELVSYNALGFESCLEELNSASCGQPVREALFDPECFGSSSPAGGDEQRRMFDRTAQPGDACKPLEDGFGGLYFGSCDPTTSFCCVDDPYGNQCNPYPVPSDEGLCQQAFPSW